VFGARERQCASAQRSKGRLVDVKGQETDVEMDRGKKQVNRRIGPGSDPVEIVAGRMTLTGSAATT
jgi:hypothetical protein